MSFEEMDVDTIWMDGEFVDWDDAQTHVLAHSLHYGTAVFEGVRCYDTADGPAILWSSTFAESNSRSRCSSQRKMAGPSAVS